METYGQLLNIAMPIFLLLFLLEAWINWRKGTSYIRSLDAVSSISSGLSNVVKDVLGLTFSIITYKWLVGKVAITHIESSVILFVVGFIVVDFQGYWVHRWNHEINFLWNRHAIHHSSEEYNLACALRQSVSVFVNYFAFLLLPAALLGVPTEMVALIGPLHLFLQYWYHTQLIGKMGWLEHILVTPSHHRVHHAINNEYLDKNYATIFIVWDKWFGTFQEELPNVKPVYGIKRPAKTWNPLKINFQHFSLLFLDAMRTKSWKDKLRIWFMPTGWRPADVAERFPIHGLVNGSEPFEKYEGAPAPLLSFWSWTQLMMTYVLVTYFFANLGQIDAFWMACYGLVVFLSIWSYTELMDGNPFAFYMELSKAVVVWGIVYYQGTWFGATAYGSAFTWLVVVFQVVSLGFTWRISQSQKQMYAQVAR